MTGVLFSTATKRAFAYRHVMTTRMTYSSLGAWLATVTAIVALGLWAGVPMTLAITALILVGIVPAAIVFRLFGRRDEQTVAEMGLRQ